MTLAQIRPFDFTKIEKVSSRQLTMVEALLRLYPQFSKEGDFFPSLAKSFERDLGLQLRARFVRFEEQSYADFIASAPAQAVLVMLRVEPAGRGAVLELDYSFCRTLIERVLGHEGELFEALRALSPLEEGVLEYLVAKAVALAKDSPAMDGPATFRLSKIVSEAKMLSDALPAEESGCILKLYLGLEASGGYARIFLPHPLVEGVFLREDMAVENETSELSEERLDRVSHIKTLLWSEIGRVSLMASEKDQLEKGDVILFDDTLANMGPQGLSGKSVLRVGEMPSEGLLAEVIDTEGKLVVKILDFFGGE